MNVLPLEINEVRVDGFRIRSKTMFTGYAITLGTTWGRGTGRSKEVPYSLLKLVTIRNLQITDTVGFGLVPWFARFLLPVTERNLVVSSSILPNSLLLDKEHTDTAFLELYGRM